METQSQRKTERRKPEMGRKKKKHHTLGAGAQSDTVGVPVGVGSRQEEARAGIGGLDFQCQDRVIEGRV